MAGPELRGIFRQPFAEQLTAWRLRLGHLVPTSRWDDLRHNAHDRAFMVAGAVKADLLADLARAVDRAISEGTGYDAFRAEFQDIVERHDWHGWTGEDSERGREWRMRTIYRTNLQTTYMAGRLAQLRESGFKYWVYRHGGSLHPRLHHLAWDGLILPADHPFWLTHFPPNGWGCSCRVFGARSIAAAIRRGGNPRLKLPANWNVPDPATGRPAGIGPGWDYAPGAGTADLIPVMAEKATDWPAGITEAFLAELPPEQSALIRAVMRSPALNTGAPAP